MQDANGTVMRATVSAVHYRFDFAKSTQVTRTMPVGNGGKFTFEARAIYDLVLEMQKACYSALRVVA